MTFAIRLEIESLNRDELVLDHNELVVLDEPIYQSSAFLVIFCETSMGESVREDLLEQKL